MKMGICGTGRIGACLATLMAGNGIDTTVVGYSGLGMERCLSIIEHNFSCLQALGKADDKQIKRALNLITITNNYAALSDAEFIMEAVIEDVDAKADVYRKLEAVADRAAIIASCTSAITSDKLFGATCIKDRFLIVHPFQPAHLQPLVEIVRSPWTSASVAAKTKEILTRRLKRRVVELKKEVPGFLVNRIAQAMFRECIYMVENGVASPGDIDEAVKYAVGIRYASIGLLEYFDDVGFSLEANIADNVYPSLCSADSVQKLVKEKIMRGETGMAYGQGFYAWNDRDIWDYTKRKETSLLSIFDWDLP